MNVTFYSSDGRALYTSSVPPRSQLYNPENVSNTFKEEIQFYGVNSDSINNIVGSFLLSCGIISCMGIVYFVCFQTEINSLATSNNNKFLRDGKNFDRTPSFPTDFNRKLEYTALEMSSTHCPDETRADT